MIAPPKPPAQDELELLIREARERQLRRRLLSAAGVAIAAAIGLSVYALAIGGNSDSAPKAPSQGGAGAPLCRSDQLTASTELNGATGSLLGAVMISNTTTEACSLPTRRPRVLIAPPSKRSPLKESVSTLPASLAPRLKAGAMAEVFIQWSNWCGRAPTAITVRFTGGLRVTAPLVDTQPPCRDASSPSGLAVSRLLRYR
jgi:hypothetical protein